jgi:hypothetical protein
MSRGIRERRGEREAWTRFVEEKQGASSTARVPGKCSVCGKDIPEERLKQNIGTCTVDCGRQAQGEKYGMKRTFYNGRWFDSQREANVAVGLEALESQGKIKNLDFQVPIILVPKDGKLRAIIYRADFVYFDPDGTRHVLDAKGFKTKEYRLKKKLAAMLLGLEIEEV